MRIRAKKIYFLIKNYLKSNIISFVMTHELLMQIIYQGIGVIALLSALSFQFKTVKKILLVQGTGSIFWCVHFLLGGAYAACIMNALCVIRSIAYIFITNKKARWAFTGVICALFIGAGVLSVLQFNELWFIAVLTGSASIAGNIFFSLENERIYKYVQLGYISPCWMFNNIWYMSIGGILCESFNIVSVIVYIIRTSIKKKTNKNEEPKSGQD